jgi:hypothetical protein
MAKGSILQGSKPFLQLFCISLVFVNIYTKRLKGPILGGMRKPGVICILLGMW